MVLMSVIVQTYSMPGMPMIGVNLSKANRPSVAMTILMAVETKVQVAEGLTVVLLEALMRRCNPAERLGACNALCQSRGRPHGKEVHHPLPPGVEGCKYAKQLKMMVHTQAPQNHMQKSVTTGHGQLLQRRQWLTDHSSVNS